MTRLGDICEEILDDVEGALGCALVDLGTGLPLAIKAASEALIDGGAMETLCAACTEYFVGEVSHQLQAASGERRNRRGARELRARRSRRPRRTATTLSVSYRGRSRHCWC